MRSFTAIRGRLVLHVLQKQLIRRRLPALHLTQQQCRYYCHCLQPILRINSREAVQFRSLSGNTSDERDVTLLSQAASTITADDLENGGETCDVQAASSSDNSISNDDLTEFGKKCESKSCMDVVNSVRDLYHGVWYSDLIQLGGDQSQKQRARVAKLQVLMRRFKVAYVHPDEEAVYQLSRCKNTLAEIHSAPFAEYYAIVFDLLNRVDTDATPKFVASVQRLLRRLSPMTSGVNKQELARLFVARSQFFGQPMPSTPARSLIHAIEVFDDQLHALHFSVDSPQLRASLHRLLDQFTGAMKTQQSATILKRYANKGFLCMVARLVLYGHIQHVEFLEQFDRLLVTHVASMRCRQSLVIPSLLLYSFSFYGCRPTFASYGDLIGRFHDPQMPLLAATAIAWSFLQYNAPLAPIVLETLARLVCGTCTTRYLFGRHSLSYEFEQVASVLVESFPHIRPDVYKHIWHMQLPSINFDVHAFPEIRLQVLSKHGYTFIPLAACVVNSKLAPWPAHVDPADLTLDIATHTDGRFVAVLVSESSDYIFDCYTQEQVLTHAFQQRIARLLGCGWTVTVLRQPASSDAVLEALSRIV